MAKYRNHYLSHPLYETWGSLLYRQRPNVDKRWWNAVNFINDVKEKPDNHRLSRIDKTKPYSKDNYKWVLCDVNNYRDNKKLAATYYNIIRYHGKENIDVEWHTFENFKKTIGEKPPNHILNKIDKTKPYGPNNYKWKPRSK